MNKICESCQFPFLETRTGCEICMDCLKTLRCLNFIKGHSLCGCGERICASNTKERRRKAEKLDRLAGHVV